MPLLHLVSDEGEIARRRKLVAPGQMVEVWRDLYTPGEFWMGETSKERLDSAGGAPLAPTLSLDGRWVPIYYGPRLCDLDALPLEESLQARVLSAHGVAAAWITLDRLGERTTYEPQSPADPVFFLRRPAGTAAHVWRLYRSRREAQVYMGEHYGTDPEASAWAQALDAESYAELVARHGIRR